MSRRQERRDIDALAQCIVKICAAVRNLQDRVEQLERQRERTSDG